MRYYKFNNQIYKADFENNLIYQYYILDNSVETDTITPGDNTSAELLVQTWINICDGDFIEISEHQYNALEELFKQKKLIIDDFKLKILVERRELEQKLNEIK